MQIVSAIGFIQYFCITFEKLTEYYCNKANDQLLMALLLVNLATPIWHHRHYGPEFAVFKAFTSKKCGTFAATTPHTQSTFCASQTVFYALDHG